MFAYDRDLVALTQTPPHSVAGVLQTFQTIDATCIDGDGLKWFNWLYMQVTSAVEGMVNTGQFHDPAWLAELDVQFASLYLAALNGFLTGGVCPKCWGAMLSLRSNHRIARIQFALAGINAHINHDLCMAIVATCTATGTIPGHGTPQYSDYTSVNGPLDSLIETAKRTFRVRLLGDALPPVSHLQDTIAAWGTSAAREQAWNYAEVLWLLKNTPPMAASYLDGLDGLTTFASKALLVSVP
jgi:hypothetical protein